MRKRTFWIVLCWSIFLSEAAWACDLQASRLDEASAMSFLDSHRRVQVMAGYTLLPMSRKDINNYIPFPGVLSPVSAQYRRQADN